MKLCIIELDRPDEPMRSRHGDYADMMERWLAPAVKEAAFSRIAFHLGEEAPEDLSEFNGYLLTGSRAGVYEDHDWISPLITLLRRIRESRIPVFGVCFGHQIMAEAFDGEAKLAPGGWVAGKFGQQLSPAGETLFGPGPLTMLSVHRDQVTKTPPGAERLTADAASPDGALIWRNFPALSFQFHPEFTADYYRDLVGSWRGERMTEEIADAALASLKGATDAARAAEGVAEFFRREGRG